MVVETLGAAIAAADNQQFITDDSTASPSCVLEAGFVSKEVMVQPIQKASSPNQERGGVNL